MTNNRSTKKALVLSMLSLMLCFSMLLGTTYAWFTDSVTSAGNIIKSGTLDVEMYWADGTEDPAATTWTDASAGAIFKYDKWEPGYVEVRHIKIENKGTLALKYSVSIVANGEVSDLADMIDVYYVDPAVQVADRAVLTADKKLGTLTEVLAGMGDTAKGELPASVNGAESAHTITIALKMQETAGNEYQDKSIGTDFSIVLFASQLAYEPDSIDDQYDANAPMAWSGETDTDWYLADPTATAFTISTAEELAGLAAIVNGTAEDIAQDNFSGQTIMLTSDIDLGDRLWTPIGTNHDINGANPFCGTFDGQGYTVYNLNIYIADNAQDSVGFIGLAKNANIKGLTIENASVNADYFVGAIVGALQTGSIYDCHVKGDINIVSRRNYAAGIVADGYYSVENCSVVAKQRGTITSAAVAGGICGRINAGAHSIKNCIVKNVDIQSGQQIAAISGFVHYGNTISGCTAENVNLTLTAAGVAKPSIGLVSGLWYYNADRLITMSGNTFKNITVNASNNVSGTTNILHGWEWNDVMTGVVDSNNTLENVTNNLIYQ